MAVVVLCAVQVVDVLGVTVLVSALPRILAGLGAAQSTAGLVAASYAMTFGGLLMLGARLGDRFGHRNVLVISLVGFAGASLLAAVSPSLALLVTARSLQGAAAAGSVPTALRLLSEVTVTERARRHSLAAWSAAGAAAGASGLLIGGVLTALTGWRALFWLNLPAAVLLIIGVLRVIPPGPPRFRLPLDLRGAALLTTGMMSLIFGASIQQPQSRVLGGALMAGGLLLLGLCALTQRRARHPLLPPLAISAPRVRLGAVASFLNTATTSSVVILATLYLQQARHTTPAAAGVSLLPFSLCVLGGSTMAGRVLQARDPALGLAAGLALIAAGDGATVPFHHSLILSACVGVVGAGLGLSSVGATTIGTDVASEAQGAAAGILNTAAQLGTALGVSGAVLLANVTEHASLPLHGDQLGWTVATLFACGGALLSLRRLQARHVPAPQSARAGRSGRHQRRSARS
jgi:MFS family permease